MAKSAVARKTESIDRMVAVYAQNGRQRRLIRRRRRAAALMGASALLAIAAYIHQMEPSLVSQLLSWVGADRGVVAVARVDDQRVGRLAAELRALEGKIIEAERYASSLDEERAALRRERAELAAAMASLDGAGAQPEAAGARLDRELEALAAQRRSLEERWAQFDAQGELLALEIVAVNAQRKELEHQRQQINRQQRELAKLIEQAGKLYERNQDSVSAAIETPPAPQSFVSTPNSLSIDPAELDEMRGGFSVGNGLDVSFGITQVGSVNGVEQYRNQMSIDSLAGAQGGMDTAGLGTMVLQNGGGNVVSPGVLDAMSNSFGQIIQNTLDDQTISTTTIYDISLQNIPGAIQGSFGEQALDQSLSVLGN